MFNDNFFFDQSFIIWFDYSIICNSSSINCNDGIYRRCQWLWLTIVIVLTLEDIARLVLVAPHPLVGIIFQEKVMVAAVDVDWVLIDDALGLSKRVIFLFRDHLD